MAATTAMARPRVPVWLMAVLLALVTMAVYWPVGHYEFINYDDPGMVVNNPLVRGGLTLRGLCWALTTFYYEYWHPLTWLSHMLDCQLFGLWPGGHHLISLGLHVANTLLLFTVLRRMTGALWRSAMVAALFALHPLHVESVAWIAERKDVLSGFFFMLTLWAYGRYVEVQSLKSKVQSQEAESETTDHASRITLHAPRFYVLALFFFACGLMSKPMLMTLPFVLLLLDYWPLRRLALPTLQFSGTPSLRLIPEKLPFFALTATSCALTYVWARHSGNLASADKEPWGLRLANVPVSYARYLGKLIWPTGLALPYPMPSHWAWWQVGGAALVLAVITLFVLWRARSAPYLIVGWLIFLGVLAPTIRLVQSGDQCIADRYTYIPSIGIFIAVVWGGCELLGCLGSARRIGLALAGSGAIVLCLALTRLQLGHWQNSEALFRHALAVTENNHLAHFNLGNALDRKGQTDEAIRQYQEALRLKPKLAEVHNNLGNLFSKKGQTDEALRQFQEATRLKPELAEAHYNLGNAFCEKGQTDEAIRQYQAALRLKPDYAEAHYNLGNVVCEKGQTDEAVSQYEEAVRLKPDFFQPHLALAQNLPRVGHLQDAAFQMEEFLRTCPRANLEAPNSPVREAALGALNDLAWLLATRPQAEERDGARAVGFAERACGLTQYQRTILVGTLAAAYAEAGRFAEAVTTAERASTLATQAGDQALLTKNRQLLELYRAGRAYHETAVPVPSPPASSQP